MAYRSTATSRQVITGHVVRRVDASKDEVARALHSAIIVPSDYVPVMNPRVLFCVRMTLQPANILMTISGEPKITDFGISAFIDSTLAQVGRDQVARPMGL